MIKQYEATYDHGTIRWEHGAPDVADACRVIVTFDLPEGAQALPADTTRVWNSVRGVWRKPGDTARDMDAIDRTLKALRDSDWNRNEMGHQS